MIESLKQFIIDVGKICLEEQHMKASGEVEYKNPKDLVTPVDRKVESELRSLIKKSYPDHDIIGEEEGEDVSGASFCWVIDPIDGTTSFYHGQPYYSISIAIKKDDDIVAAAVYAPTLGQLFHAEKGGGAYLNGKVLSVSACSELKAAVLATGFACLRAGHEHNNLIYFNRLVPNIRDIRRCGSAALDLCYVAAGKYDGFWELNLHLYDIAAGVLLVREAGGAICDFAGGQEFPEKGIAAANETLLEGLLPYLVRDSG